MLRYAWVVEYDGRPFCGWQSQPTGNSVQQTLETAISNAINHPVRLTGASRTDAGVSALAQVAQAHLPRRFPVAQLIYRTQYYLNTPNAKSIAIKTAILAPPRFYAQHSATNKTYQYTVLNQSYPPALERGWWIKYPLDIKLIQSALNVLVGTHDFSSFQSAHCTKHATRTISLFQVIQKGSKIIFTCTGKSFLIHQIRIMIGTAIEPNKYRTHLVRKRSKTRGTNSASKWIGTAKNTI